MNTVVDLLCKCGHTPTDHLDNGRGQCRVNLAPEGEPEDLCPCAQYWRASWRDRTPKLGTTKHDARHPEANRLPAPDEIRQRALRALLNTVEHESSGVMARVAASKALLDATEPNLRKLLLQMLDGDDQRLEEFLVSELEAVRQRMGKSA